MTVQSLNKSPLDQLGQFRNVPTSRTVTTLEEREQLWQGKQHRCIEIYNSSGIINYYDLWRMNSRMNKGPRAVKIEGEMRGGTRGKARLCD